MYAPGENQAPIDWKDDNQALWDVPRENIRTVYYHRKNQRIFFKKHPHLVIKGTNIKVHSKNVYMVPHMKTITETVMMNSGFYEKTNQELKDLLGMNFLNPVVFNLSLDENFDKIKIHLVAPLYPKRYDGKWIDAQMIRIMESENMNIDNMFLYFMNSVDREYGEFLDLWQDRLLRLEGTRLWFKLWKKIIEYCQNYPTNVNKVLEKEVAEDRIYFNLHFKMSPSWLKFLNDCNFFSYFTRYNPSEYSNLLHLLCSGDVELNPGPVFSKLDMRNNHPSISRMNAQVFGMDTLQDLHKDLENVLPQIVEKIIHSLDIFSANNAFLVQQCDNSIKEDLAILKNNSMDLVSKLANISNDFILGIICSILVFFFVCE